MVVTGRLGQMGPTGLSPLTTANEAVAKAPGTPPLGIPVAAVPDQGWGAGPGRRGPGMGRERCPADRQQAIGPLGLAVGGLGPIGPGHGAALGMGIVQPRRRSHDYRAGLAFNLAEPMRSGHPRDIAHGDNDT